MNHIYQLVYPAYLAMRRNRLTFRLMIRLREIGAQGTIKELLLYPKARKQWKKEIAQPTDEMKETRDFLFKNKKRIKSIKSMLSLLADDKSRMSWKAAMRFKAERRPIPKSLYSTDDEYFVKDIIALSDQEVFIDGGAYIGDSTQQLFDIAGKEKKKIKKVVMFEPNPKNIQVIQKNFDMSHITLVPKGLYDREMEGLKFELADENVNENARVAEGDKEDMSTIFHSLEEKAYSVLPVTTIDRQESCRDATFIKLCVEGSEMRALQGAKETIKRNKPKLAVCIYHNNDNMVRIIEYVHELVPDYKLFVRHHTFEMDQTVLYAVL